jgi:hypothetical protein
MRERKREKGHQERPEREKEGQWAKGLSSTLSSLTRKPIDVVEEK